MKILIISDSHGFTSMLRTIIEKENNCDMIIHLGDGSRDMSAVNDITAGKPICQLKGNCDILSCNFSDKFISFADDFKFFACHGHNYNVKISLHSLFYAAKEYDCRFAFYGHTHIPAQEESEGIILFNPGSVTNGCYGILITDKNDFTLENRKI